MNSLQIKYFLHLCETLNITKTSKQLYVAQPSISKQLNRLEDELGYPLFIRSNRGLMLTNSGQVMYNFFRQAAGEYKTANETAVMLAQKQRRKIRIGALESLGIPEVQDYLSSLSTQQPDLELTLTRLSNHDLMSRLINRRIDIAITFDHALYLDFIKNQKICYEELLLDQSCFIISKKNSLYAKEDLKPSDLSGQVFCQNWMGNDQSDQYLQSILRLFGIKPKRLISVENLASGIETIELNLAVGLIDERIQLNLEEQFRVIPTGTYQSIVAAWIPGPDQEYLQHFSVQLRNAFPTTEKMDLP